MTTEKNKKFGILHKLTSMQKYFFKPEEYSFTALFNLNNTVYDYSFTALCHLNNKAYMFIPQFKVEGNTMQIKAYQGELYYDYYTHKYKEGRCLLLDKDGKQRYFALQELKNTECEIQQTSGKKLSHIVFKSDDIESSQVIFDYCWHSKDLMIAVETLNDERVLIILCTTLMPTNPRIDEFDGIIQYIPIWFSNSKSLSEQLKQNI